MLRQVHQKHIFLLGSVSEYHQGNTLFEKGWCIKLAQQQDQFKPEEIM